LRRYQQAHESFSEPWSPSDSGVGEGTPALSHFKRGLALLRDGNADEALEPLREAARREPQNPYYVSFYGLCVARAQKKWAAARELCEAALRWKPYESQLHLNLAEVYVAAGERDAAVETLDKALRYCKPDARIKRARSRLGQRYSPLIPFFERGHFVNRTLGKLRHRAMQRLRKYGDG
jgi:predicted Zn-dependent protease